MKIGGIKFDKDTFISIKVNDGEISLSVTDEAGEVTEYEVTPANKRKRSTKKEGDE